MGLLCTGELFLNIDGALVYVSVFCRTESPVIAATEAQLKYRSPSSIIMKIHSEVLRQTKNSLRRSTQLRCWHKISEEGAKSCLRSEKRTSYFATREISLRSIFKL